MNAEQSLKKVLSQYPALMVAFSGGADSSVLLAAASRFVPRVMAVQCVGPMCPPWEIEQAGELAVKLGVELRQLDAHELQRAEIVANDERRCYYCKHYKMSRLKQLAGELGFGAVADGSQTDDFKASRPGNQALKELDIKSPLAQAGLNKSQVRELARAWKLTASPASACLATRIPTHTPLNARSLLRIGRAESLLRGHFQGIVRLRDNFPQARLEVENHELDKARELYAGLLEQISPLGYENLAIAVYNTIMNLKEN